MSTYKHQSTLGRWKKGVSVITLYHKRKEERAENLLTRNHQKNASMQETPSFSTEQPRFDAFRTSHRIARCVLGKLETGDCFAAE
jgi:hypothetical protein